MNVIFIPSDTANPYQTLLSYSLRKIGHHIDLITPAGTMPLVTLYRNMESLDVIHLHWTDWLHASLESRLTIIRRTFRFFLELFYLRTRGVKIIWTVHNLRNHEEKNSTIDYLISKAMTIAAHKIIVHSDSARDLVIAHYNFPPRYQDKISIIPHGNFISSYPNNSSQEEAREKLGIRRDETVFLLFGQIRPYKGVTDLISAFSSLDLPHTRLIIAGRAIDELFREELIQLCKGRKNIDLILEFIPRDDIQYYMKACDIVALPYRDYLTSGASILAMSFARPVLMPKTSCSEAILDGSSNILYPPTENGLEAALLESLKRDLVKMGNQNYLNALSLDWSEIAQMTSVLYED